MPDAAAPLLSPALRAGLARLRLVARHPAAGRGLGLHASRARGAGLEFAQYRAYEPGDDLRRIDWKLYARADRYYVRDAERESPLQLWLVVDVSRSMAQTDRAEGGVSRLDVARRLAAALVTLATTQGDACGLLAVGGRTPLHIPAAGGRRHAERLLYTLSQLRADADAPDGGLLGSQLAVIGEHALVAVFSDGFDAGLIDAALRLAALRRDLRWVSLRTGDERDFPFSAALRLRDPEDGRRIDVDAPRQRERFLARARTERAQLAERLRGAGALALFHDLDGDPLPLLRRLAQPTG